MSFFDFFRKKTVKAEKLWVQNKVPTGNSKQTKSVTSPIVKVTTQIMPSGTDDVIPAEKRIKNANVSKHGLYPHEVLVLYYAGSYFTEGNSFQGFWWYKYGVRDVDNCLRSLLDRGFLQVGNLQSAIEKETATVLKSELKNHGLKVSGKKDELVQRLMAEVSHEELNSRFAKRTYQLTELEKKALEEEDYVPYIHRHPIENMDIWSLNKIIYEPPYMSYRDKIWGYLNKRSMEHFSVGDFGLYRNCRYHMYLFLMEEKRLKDALGMLSEVVFYDLSGLGNNYNPQYLSIFAKNFFPYKDSTVTMAPGITSAVIQCQKELDLTDKELKTAMIDRMNCLSTPLHLFTPEECVDIVFMESREDTEAITKIYAKAKRRFKQSFPEIKC
ncbi:SAP domain-containing protein [Paenibacillus apiarius]|uniref:SAP domain-containing protein n=1 Tax=Paenibacillus apiarius TaxID=46240 RepID=UPI001980EAC9|nr:SAP domain-containing protein [Paenibacillus apiarius]MBN3525064.1 SAP domain-containing protein [Paenibacillus apiarius]